MSRIKEAIAAADEINCALLDAQNALNEIYAPEPEGPVPKVLEADRRHERIRQIMVELGTALSRTRYGHDVATGLVVGVRVIRGERAETVYETRYMQT